MAIESLAVSNHANTTSLSRVNESISSGSSINSSADDAAGSAVIMALTKQIKNDNVAIQNASTGINLIQTADSAVDSITSQLQSLNELSVQAANGTLSPSQRDIINEQFKIGLDSINQFANSAQFNGINLLDGSNTEIDIALDSDNISTINLPELSTGTLGLDGLDLTNSTNIGLAQEGIANALLGIADAQAGFGAQQNGLSSAVTNLESKNLSATAARSQIGDTDYARAVADQVRLQVLNQAGTAMQAQSNQSQANVLQLLA